MSNVSIARYLLQFIQQQMFQRKVFGYDGKQCSSSRQKAQICRDDYSIKNRKHSSTQISIDAC